MLFPKFRATEVADKNQKIYINFFHSPNYASEIPHLLYGMNCESLSTLMETNGLDLRSFLLLDEPDMIKMGIELPYERQRLVQGLKHFHMRGWKLNAVAGLYARNMNNYRYRFYYSVSSGHARPLSDIGLCHIGTQFSFHAFQLIGPASRRALDTASPSSEFKIYG